MKRILWCLKYAHMALRSPYEFTILSAWQEAWASWDENNYNRLSDPMPTPGEAIYEDQFEWCDR